ncbi:MAG TPA: hypothetical protein DEQ40_16425 [Oxalobacteraceae bacterium]|jgi:hypothetical protein|nr:hypothetical protein [Oxalobacteraceae bacterium]
MIFAFPDVMKAAADVEAVTLDWSPYLPTLATGATVSSHSISTSCGDVVAQDTGMTAAVQSVKLSGGTCQSFTDVIAHVVLSDTTDLSRAFRVLVR